MVMPIISEVPDIFSKLPSQSALFEPFISSSMPGLIQFIEPCMIITLLKVSIDQNRAKMEDAMAWIETIGEGTAKVELAELYEQSADPATGRVDNILKVHSLHPAGLSAHLALYRAAMEGTTKLPRVEREMIASVVSGINGCEY